MATMTDEAQPRRAAGRQRRRRRRPGPVSWTVLALVVVLLAALGWGGWQVWGTDAMARAGAAEQVVRARSDWAALPTSPADAAAGEVIAVVSIPALGLEWPVVVGVDDAQLRQGVGWYRSTAWPGEIGNTVLAGLRITHGSPFRDLPALQVGDEIVLETSRARLTYEVAVPAGEVTVDAGADWVLDPVPGHPGVPPNQPLLTLTTAQDLVATGERSVAFATLVSRSDR